jgi:hypothetical protein
MQCVSQRRRSRRRVLGSRDRNSGIQVTRGDWRVVRIGNYPTRGPQRAPDLISAALGTDVEVDGITDRRQPVPSACGRSFAAHAGRCPSSSSWISLCACSAVASTWGRGAAPSGPTSGRSPWRAPSRPRVRSWPSMARSRTSRRCRPRGRESLHRLLNPVAALVRSHSEAQIAARRTILSRAPEAAGLPPRTFNGAGTGSFDWAAAEGALTELTAGSALLSSHLFEDGRQRSASRRVGAWGRAVYVTVDEGEQCARCPARRARRRCGRGCASRRRGATARVARPRGSNRGRGRALRGRRRSRR